MRGSGQFLFAVFWWLGWVSYSGQIALANSSTLPGLPHLRVSFIAILISDVIPVLKATAEAP